MTSFTIPGMSEKQGSRGCRAAAEGAQHVQRPAPDAQARALERRRPELHRRPRDDRPAGRTGPRIRRRGRRAHRRPRQVAAGHARERSSRTAPGTTTRSTATPCRRTSPRSTWSTTGVDRGHPQEHRPARGPRPGVRGHADRPRRRAGEVPVVRAGAPGELGRPARHRGRQAPRRPPRARPRRSPSCSRGLSGRQSVAPRGPRGRRAPIACASATPLLRPTCSGLAR